MAPTKRALTRGAVVVAAALLMAPVTAGSAAAGGSAADGGGSRHVSMLGKWSGFRERIADVEGYRNGPVTLTVREQQGKTFRGVMRWSTPDGPRQDRLVGAFTPGAELMAGADAEGTYSFELLDRNTLDYCYTESGEGFRTTCGRLHRHR
ncbi:hypothetical protein E4198_11475 [Streptomyces sp. RKND-216]|uniref:hypothetical protein n=1 Tax=Streptomyces sp. RKND-216 TaxID=2562581 RepID=UPI00109DF818|nr:hypothetical protein [Streptomyces sp. RKND-216]THA25263.1 hypothetical protein E4198_11475 [Streptomyces sp. RKND-216]